MTINSKFIFKIGVYFSLICLSSCWYDKENISDVNLIQNDTEYTLDRPSSSIKLMKASFELIFYQKKYDSEIEGKYNTVRIAALSDRALFNSIKVGQSFNDIGFLSIGRGMAPYRDGYRDIIITNEGHHYIYYKDELDNRAILEKRLDNGYLKLHFPVYQVFTENQSYSLSDAPIEQLLLVIVIDRNHDAVIDRDELTKLEIRFISSY